LGTRMSCELRRMRSSTSGRSLVVVPLAAGTGTLGTCATFSLHPGTCCPAARGRRAFRRRPGQENQSCAALQCFPHIRSTRAGFVQLLLTALVEFRNWQTAHECHATNVASRFRWRRKISRLSRSFLRLCIRGSDDEGWSSWPIKLQRAACGASAYGVLKKLRIGAYSA